MPQDKTLVNLEGNIGAGKSTLLRVLKAAYGGCSAVRFVDEPVAQWERAGLLAALYAGKMSPAAFQLTAMVTRAAALKETLADPFAKVIISERSLASDRAVFAATQLSGADRDAYDRDERRDERRPVVAAEARDARERDRSRRSRLAIFLGKAQLAQRLERALRGLVALLLKTTRPSKLARVDAL